MNKVFIFSTFYSFFHFPNEDNYLFSTTNCNENSTMDYCKINGKKIYAVNPHENGGKEWIQCLLANDFIGSIDKIFLLLHDKDIYDKGEPFKVLDEKEIKNYTSKDINMLVFQHEDNPVIKILHTKELTNIECKIEIIFYKYLLKRALIEYANVLGYGNENEVKVKKENVQKLYNKHIEEYQKIEKLPNLSEEENLTNIMDEINNWKRLLL